MGCGRVWLCAASMLRPYYKLCSRSLAAVMKASHVMIGLARNVGINVMSISLCGKGNNFANDVAFLGVVFSFESMKRR